MESNSTGAATPGEPSADFDPENVSLEPTQDAHFADVFAYPDIGANESADELAPLGVQPADVSTDGDETAPETESPDEPTTSDPNPNPDAESESSVSEEVPEARGETAGGDTATDKLEPTPP